MPRGARRTAPSVARLSVALCDRTIQCWPCTTVDPQVLGLNQKYDVLEFLNHTRVLSRPHAKDVFRLVPIASRTQLAARFDSVRTNDVREAYGKPHKEGRRHAILEPIDSCDGLFFEAICNDLLLLWVADPVLANSGIPIKLELRDVIHSGVTRRGNLCDEVRRALAPALTELGRIAHNGYVGFDEGRFIRKEIHGEGAWVNLA